MSMQCSEKLNKDKKILKTKTEKQGLQKCRTVAPQTSPTPSIAKNILRRGWRLPALNQSTTRVSFLPCTGKLSHSL